MIDKPVDLLLKTIGAYSAHETMSASTIRWLLESGLAISLLIIMILIIRRPVARIFGPSFAYLLWALPVIRLFLPKLNILPPAAPEKIIAPVVEYQINAQALRSLNTDVTQSISDHHLLIGIPSLLLVLWISVSALWLLSALARQGSFSHDLKQKSSPLGSADQQRATALAKKFNLSSRVQVRISTHADDPNVTSPLVTGLLNPMIVLPENFLSRYSSEEQKCALIHEFIHVQRNDLWASFAMTCLSALFWFNPLMTIAYRAFRADQEASCDSKALKFLKTQNALTPCDDKPSQKTNLRHVYASTLVKAASYVKPTITVPRTTPHQVRLTLNYSTKERLHLMKNNPTALTRTAGVLITGLISITGLMVSASYGYSGTPQDQSQNTPVPLLEGVPTRPADPSEPPAPPNAPDIEFSELDKAHIVIDNEVVTFSSNDSLDWVTDLQELEKLSGLEGLSQLEGHHITRAIKISLDDDMPISAKISCVSFTDKNGKTLPANVTADFIAKHKDEKTKDGKQAAGAMIIKMRNKNSDTISEDISALPGMLACKDGEVIVNEFATKEIEVEALREAVEHLRHEEETIADRLREKREQLEQRLKELEGN